MEREQAINYMRDLLKVIVEKKGSDLFVTVDFPPAIKIDGKIVPVSKTKLTSNNTKALAYAIMNDKQVKEFEATSSIARCNSRCKQRWSVVEGRDHSQSRSDRYSSMYLSAMRSTVNRANTAARQAARSISPMRPIASTASSMLSTKKPVTP